MIFRYGKKEIDYLSKRDANLGAAIERIGPLRREIDPDLFGSVAFFIVGQQISGPAQMSVWRRLVERLGTVDADTVTRTPIETLQSCGMSFRKAEYIAEFARTVHSGALDLAALKTAPDAQIVESLTAVRGLGVWTAEMLLIFSLARPDVVSFGDLGILRGMRMLYRHRKITREMFARYRRRYSPFGTVASFYLWEIAGGTLDELTDPGIRRSGK